MTFHFDKLLAVFEKGIDEELCFFLFFLDNKQYNLTRIWLRDVQGVQRCVQSRIRCAGLVS